MSLQITIIPVTPFQQNCSIIVCSETQKAAVVDPGGDVVKICAALSELNVTLEKILITHAHIDHVGGTADLLDKFPVPIEGPHTADQFWIDQLPQQSAMLQFPQARKFTPSRWLQDNDSVSVGNLQFDVVHCPGHTPGHVVFVNKKESIALVGDVIFQGSIGRTDFPQSDHQQLVDSIQNKLFPLGDEITFVPGHGPNSTFGHERETNPFVSDKRG